MDLARRRDKEPPNLDIPNEASLVAERICAWPGSNVHPTLLTRRIDLEVIS
jgi:hypothetical protein